MLLHHCMHFYFCTAITLHTLHDRLHTFQDSDIVVVLTLQAIAVVAIAPSKIVAWAASNY